MKYRQQKNKIYKWANICQQELCLVKDVSISQDGEHKFELPLRYMITFSTRQHFKQYYFKWMIYVKNPNKKTELIFNCFKFFFSVFFTPHQFC